MSVINKTTELLPTPAGRSSGSKEPCPDFPFPSQGTAQPPLPLDQHLAPTFMFKEDPPLLLHRGFSELTVTLHVLPTFLVSIDRETLRMKSIHHSLFLEAACFTLHTQTILSYYDRKPPSITVLCVKLCTFIPEFTHSYN